MMKQRCILGGSRGMKVAMDALSSLVQLNINCLYHWGRAPCYLAATAGCHQSRSFVVTAAYQNQVSQLEQNGMEGMFFFSIGALECVPWLVSSWELSCQ
jgi:hypothetical protein